PNLVAAQKHSGSTPVANGSSVPVCPAFSARNNHLHFCNALLLDRSSGLSSSNTPCTDQRKILGSDSNFRIDRPLEAGPRKLESNPNTFLVFFCPRGDRLDNQGVHVGHTFD